MNQLGKYIIIAGIILILLGILVLAGSKLGIGRLPGDIVIKRKNFIFYFPLLTSIILSIILSAVFWIIRKLK